MASTRVLVVDDDVQYLTLLATMVGEGGYTVESKSRFEDAKRALGQHPPDALVTDIRLGAFNGLQLALQMRDAKPTASIVVLSAFDDPMLRQQAASCAAHYFVKPVAAQALLAALEAGPAEPTA